MSIHPTIQKYTGTRLDLATKLWELKTKLKLLAVVNTVLLSDSQRLVKLSKVNPELDQLFQAYASLDDVNS